MNNQKVKGSFNPALKYCMRILGLEIRNLTSDVLKSSKGRWTASYRKLSIHGGNMRTRNKP